MTIDPDPTAPAAEPPFSILVVCTGNICRSPLAEQLLTTRLTNSGIPVRVTSAGTYAMVGKGMPDEAAALSVRYGGDPRAHVSRQLTARLVADADLVVTADREHRGEVVSLHPRAARYAFTLNQLARLIDGLRDAEFAAAEHAAAERPGADSAPVGHSDHNAGTAPLTAADTLRAFIAEIAASRGLTPPPADPADDDIGDPYRRSLATYDRVGVAIDASAATIATALTGALTKVA
ncbi:MULTISPECIES: low molecular weight phosphatase family protein [Cryobacterium]|uniref:protein-tyrosine-phosphatase n=1 Tax=Cryobacterium glucosi TaxID=1259175 RepID=A0ABY2IMX2_9MICO|nr:MULTISPECIES: low molecular weight phosphatase family protein [Cryobacterium]TFC01334.1 low molecular weight phosphatase family protein [Cryobacterium sp. MDB2-A-1]TFC09153.1 low molecular weight phosphatase family protein [Cryobacterium sp. MDB2-A-2]TFC18041.1 low molecular weight phosphatase family protein [Cryobacterium glucosi]TFC22932.1 low molecular weight phosphatase family protein [Cryobacterium sp. MDB2-10]